MKKPLLRVKDLSYTYDNASYVLDSVSLDIFEGEKIAVIGSNGAGKSTFFLNLNGVLTPDGGEIFYRDKKIGKKDLNELRKNIGIVFQDADNQIIASTVLAEVSFGPLNLGLSRSETTERVEEALKYMNIDGFKNRPPHYLSGGEKKRVSIADIIAMKPEVIIFDEPAASLDPVNASMLESVLDRLSEENKTIIISSHDMDFVYRWADRIVVFSDGKIIADGLTGHIFRDYNILERADLKKPVIFEICEILEENRVVSFDGEKPRCAWEFRRFIEDLKK